MSSVYPKQKGSPPVRPRQLSGGGGAGGGAKFIPALPAIGGAAARLGLVGAGRWAVARGALPWLVGVTAGGFSLYKSLYGRGATVSLSNLEAACNTGQPTHWVTTNPYMCGVEYGYTTGTGLSTSFIDPGFGWTSGLRFVGNQPWPPNPDPTYDIYEVVVRYRRYPNPFAPGSLTNVPATLYQTPQVVPWVPPVFLDPAIPKPAVDPVAPPPEAQPAPIGREGSTAGQPARPRPPVTTTQPLPRRPGPREREKKGKTTKAVAKLMGIGFAVTEACDVVEALYEALPKSIRRSDKVAAKEAGRKVKCGEQMATVLKMWRLIDLDDAVRNLLRNLIEDAFVGGVAMKMDAIRKALGLSTTRGLENAIQPFIQGVDVPSGVGAAAKQLDKAVEAALDYLSRDTDFTAGELQSALWKDLLQWGKP